MTNTAIERRKEQRLKYQIQVRPGMMRLIAEFEGFQTDAMKRFINLLFQADDQRNNDDHDRDVSDSSHKLAFVTSED